MGSSTDTVAGTLGKKFTVYNIQVILESGKGWIVQRRYSQFYALDLAMKKYFRGTPKLPPKTLGQMSSKVVKTRIQSLQIYLELLLDDTLTRKATPLLEFLSCDSDSIQNDVTESEEYFEVVESPATKKKKERKNPNPKNPNFQK